jgi:YQGE family putative transporter
MGANNISAVGVKRLLLSHNIFNAGRVFFEIFLSVFIWKTTQDLTLVAWFNIVYLLVHVLTFHGFALLVKRGMTHVPRITALLGYSLVYLVIFALQEDAVKYVIPIAAAIGLFNGMYWISYQTTRFNLTNRENRGNYSGLEMGTKTLVAIIMPVFGGAVITADYFGFGYANLFLIGSVLFLVSLFVGNVHFPVRNKSRLHARETFSLLWKNPDIRKSMLGHFFGSFSRGGTIIRLVLPLIIFEATQSELQLGGWLSLFSVAAILSSFAFGKLVDYKHYKTWMFTSGIIYTVLITLIAFYPSFWAYVLFGALAQILTVAIFIPKRTISENLVHTLENEDDHKIEYIVIREWFNIGFGRMLSFIILLTVGGLADDQMRFLLLLMAAAVLVEVSLLRSIKEKV